MSAKKELLGEIFIKKGLITHDELEDALRYQQQNKKFLGSILVERGLISEKQLLDALSEQLDIAVASIKNMDVDMKLADLFSKSLIIEHECFPVKKTADTIIMAVRDPLDAWIVAEAEEQVKDYRIERVLVAGAEMDELLGRYRKYIRTKIRKLFGS